MKVVHWGKRANTDREVEKGYREGKTGKEYIPLNLLPWRMLEA